MAVDQRPAALQPAASFLPAIEDFPFAGLDPTQAFADLRDYAARVAVAVERHRHRVTDCRRSGDAAAVAGVGVFADQNVPVADFAGAVS